MSLLEFLSFLKQFGLAIGGAASLWSAFLMYKVWQNKDAEKERVFRWLTSKYNLLLAAGLGISVLAWITIYIINPIKSWAHEGITIDPSLPQYLAGMNIRAWLFVILLLLIIVYLAAYKKLLKAGAKSLFYVYTVLFLLFFTAISFPAWTGSFNNSQLFFAGHSFHSIFTVGTVYILDITMFLCLGSELFKKHIYPLLPTISKVIWVGLGLDFLSVALIFNQGLELTPKFFFMQTVVAIIIMNGAFLSGPIAQKFMNSVHKPVSEKWMKIASISGVVSISSWTTITFVDFAKSLPLTYVQLLGIYILLISVVYLGHRLTGPLLNKRLSQLTSKI